MAPNYGAAPLFFVVLVLVLVLVLDFGLTKPRKVEGDDEDRNEHNWSPP